MLSLACFLSRANWSLRRRVLDDRAVAVVVAGVTAIGDIRGSPGGPAADEAVRAVAGWVLAAPGPADSAVLMDGGEFAILCGGVRESSETDAVIRRISDAMTRHFDVGGVPVPVATATGMAMASSPEDTAERLLGAAGSAMHAARRWDVAGTTGPLQARGAVVASHVPAPRPGDGCTQVAAADRATSSSAVVADTELTEIMVHRLFGVGLVLQSAAGLADGSVAAQIGQAMDELDAVIRDARTAAFRPGPPRARHSREDRVRTKAQA